MYHVIYKCIGVLYRTDMNLFLSKKRKGMEHMVDADTILSEEEKVLIDESFKHEKEGKLVSISEFM